jgi:amino-acid N-acetyltransferase
VPVTTGDQLREQVDLIRQAFSYVNRFRGRLFVIKIDSSLIKQALFQVLIGDISLLCRMGIHVVIVPGAQRRIDEILEQNNIESRSERGIRITPTQAIPAVKMAAFDVATTTMTALSAANQHAVIGNWVRARGIGVEDGIDFGATGKPERIQVDLVQSVIDDGLVPILPCIGWSLSGDPYNLSSDELAGAVASSMAASKLFFVTDGGGVSASRYELPAGVGISNSGTLSRLSKTETDAFLDANAASDQEIAEDRPLSLLALARDACARGVQRVHIIDGKVEGVLLKEIFSTLGYGTMVHANEYESVRPMQVRDVPEVIRLMQPLVESGVLIHRSEKDVRNRYRDFVVFEIDGTVRACGALHRLSESECEIAGIAVDEHFSQLGIGQKIVSYLMEQARGASYGRIIVLTTQAWDWFRSLGFREGQLGDIPRSRRATYDPQRRSRVLLYDIEQDVAV